MGSICAIRFAARHSHQTKRWKSCPRSAKHCSLPTAGRAPPRHQTREHPPGSRRPSEDRKICAEELRIQLETIRTPVPPEPRVNPWQRRLFILILGIIPVPLVLLHLPLLAHRGAQALAHRRASRTQTSRRRQAVTHERECRGGGDPSIAQSIPRHSHR